MYRRKFKLTDNLELKYKVMKYKNSKFPRGSRPKPESKNAFQNMWTIQCITPHKINTQLQPVQ